MGYRLGISVCPYCQGKQEYVDGVNRIFCASCCKFKGYDAKHRQRPIQTIPYTGEGLQVEELEQR